MKVDIDRLRQSERMLDRATDRLRESVERIDSGGQELAAAARRLAGADLPCTAKLRPGQRESDDAPNGRTCANCGAPLTGRKKVACGDECRNELHRKQRPATVSAEPPFHPAANIFPLLEGPEFDELVADIRKNGLREPIVLHDGAILDGRNRYRACEQAGVACRAEVYDGDDPIAYVVSLNLKRRHLNESQRAMVAAKAATLRDGQRADRVQGAQICAPATQDEAAAMLNVGKRSVQHARTVRYRGADELQAAVESGRVSVSAAAEVATLPDEEQRALVARGEQEIKTKAATIRQRRAAENRRVRAEIAAQEVILPDGLFHSIVVDPPWPMKKIDRDVRLNQAGFDYPTMTEDEIAAFPIPGMAADDCHLFLWTTQRFLPAAFDVLSAWEFRYVCTFVWHKAGGFQPVGLPQYNCEFALYARRGSPKFLSTKEFPVCFQAARREHSRKPDEFYRLVARVCPEPRVDVFAREAREGFAQHGNEADRFNGDGQ